MSSKIVNFEIILIYFLLLIPWPHTHFIKLFCSRDNSRLVRKIVRSKWTPILDKYQVKLPLECPLHPFRDIFAPRQDAKKRDRPTQWTCRKCGKSFYQEKFLDLHFETRHRNILNKDEDAVCLADFCDIMRCEIFESEESKSLTIGDTHVVTDIEVWGDSLGQNSALAKANTAYLSLIPLRTSVSGASRAAKVQQNRQLCQDQIGQNKFKDTQKDTHYAEKPESSERSKTTNDSVKKRGSAIGSNMNTASTATHHGKNSAKAEKTNTKSHNSNQSDELKNHNSDGGDTNSSANNSSNGNRTQNGNAQNMQKVRANCRAEELSKLKTKCEYLVRSCIAGLLLSMTDHAFKEMEEEMNKAVCWYLSCDRYWEDGPLEPRAFPWGLIVILVFVLSTGICFCYYIIWILFDSEEATINANFLHQQHYMHHQQQQQQQQQQQYQQHPGAIYGTVHPQHYYYQQQHDLYPEQPRYDYRHSPRRYSERAQQGTPTSAHGHHVTQQQQQLQQQQQQQQQNLNYQPDIFDRRDYTNRTMSTAAATSGSNNSNLGPNANVAAGTAAAAGGGATSNTAGVNVAHMDANLVGGIGADPNIGEGLRHYNPNQHHHQLEQHHRHKGASQTSLRGSVSSHEIIQGEVGQNEHYIYVTYPPDLKKRFFEKYE